MESGSRLSLVLAGHVDHGKSSLLGRLLHELGLLPAGKAEELEALSAKRGVPLEWSFALDGFQAERNQAITLDTTRVRVKTPSREFVVIDAPGHKELLKNMIGGASAASAALLVVDAAAGNEEQTLRHAYLLRLLGVRELVVAVNKMDIPAYSEVVFRRLEAEVSAALGRIGIVARAIVPVSARDGANLIARGAMGAWYRGPTLIAALEDIPTVTPAQSLPLRLPVQDVYRRDTVRIIAGRIESGSLSAGDELLFSPSGQTATVSQLLAWNDDAPTTATASDNVGFLLDRPLVVERGDLASHRAQAPKLTPVFDAEIFWLASKPLVAGVELSMQFALRSVNVRVQAIRHRTDPATLEPQLVSCVEANEIASVTIRASESIGVDNFADLPATGRFVLRDGYQTVGGGVIDATGYPDQRAVHAAPRELSTTTHDVSERERAKRFGHSGRGRLADGSIRSGQIDARDAARAAPL